MRYLLLFLFISLLISCKNKEPIKPVAVYVEPVCSFELEQLDAIVELEECNLQFSKLNYIQIETIGDEDTSFVTEFIIDNCGKVTQEIHNNYYDDNSSYESEFKYNEDGKVIKEIRNGLYRYVEWVDNKAKVYDKDCIKKSEFIFESDLLVKQTSFFLHSQEDNFTLKYDSIGNLTSIIDDRLNLAYEYFDFNADIENPFHLLKSINILRFDLKTFMRYRHETEKQNEHTAEGVTYPLRFYALTYELDSIDRVIKIDNPKYFYTSIFSYD